LLNFITTNSRPAAASQLSELLRQGFSPRNNAVAATQSAPGRRALPLAPRRITIAPGGHRLWAADRLMPEAASLIQGLDCLMETVELCCGRRVEQLTFLALPSDHALDAYERSDLASGSGGYWLPALMRAVWAALNKLPRLGVRLRLEGDWPALDGLLMAALLETQARTRWNTGMQLNLRPAKPLALWGAQEAQVSAAAAWAPDTSTAAGSSVGGTGSTSCPEADLVIRTGGCTLSSDGMVWDTTQTALYFTNRAWPDFTGLDLRRALHWYGTEGRAGGMQVGLAPRRHTSESAAEGGRA
jgi:undecaprenyl diphosphate synthase